jgi:holo-[acyl-carrier protein] synthase
VIVGVGTDLCSISRLSEALERTPNLKARLFHSSEQELPVNSLAARFAAKEAIAKALGDPKILVWNEIALSKDSNGKPEFEFFGTTKANLEKLGYRFFVSISHEQELASAFVVVEAN